MWFVSLASQLVVWCRRILGGLVATILLLPLPGFALTWLDSWEVTSSSNAGFYADDSFNRLTILTPNLTESSTIVLTRYVVTTSSEQIGVNALVGDITLSGLATLDVKVQIDSQVLINKTGGNQFTSAAGNGPKNSSGSTSDLTSGSYLVTVTFELKENGSGSYNIAFPSTPTSIFNFSSLP